MQKTHVCKILDIDQITPDVKSFKLQKPQDYNFNAGDATSISINKPELIKQIRPYTFSGIPQYDYLEITAKIYVNRDGFTKELNNLSVGDELLIRSAYSSFSYKGEGTFIAGGAGITPFLSIFRYLKEINSTDENFLFYSNKKEQGIIQKEDLENLLGKDNCVFTLSQENLEHLEFGRITEKLLKKYGLDISKPVYICGPPPMVRDIKNIVVGLGADPSTIEF